MPVERALELMLGFAERTGLRPDREPRRYLWTDAFAVCNFLGLWRATGRSPPRELALSLVDRVHHVLGRFRPGDPRRGWISGLDEPAGEAHPTHGGLRIGKPLPERGSHEPLDHRLEWDRDGQYFHYLTKWMHALDQVSRATGRAEYTVWARELAEAAHRAFTYTPRGSTRKRMYWKMSVDLSRALVPSMGQHDPLDGFVTCTQLAATPVEGGPDLSAAAADFASMIEPDSLETDDPLGLGGLLVDACRLVQLERELDLVRALLDAADSGLARFGALFDPTAPAGHRLAFRELGLAIGLAAAKRIEQRQPPGSSARASAARLARSPLRAHIESFWLTPAHRRASSWLEHADINDVMLATSLAPEGFLVLGDA